MHTAAYSVQRFRRAVLQYAGGRIAQAAARVVLVLVLVRVLPVAEYGAYMLIIGTAELLPQVASFGLGPLAQRYLPQMLTTLPRRKLYQFVAFLLVAQLAILGLITWAAYLTWGLVTPVFGMTPEQAEMTRFAAWMLLIIPAFRFSTDMLEAMLAPGQAARALMVTGRAAAVVVLVLLKPQVTLADILLVDIVVTALCVLFNWTRIERNLASLHSPAARGALPLREMIRFASHMALVGPMSGTANPAAIRLVLANSLGLAESGLYAFLQTLERLVSRYLPETLLRNLIRPVLISRFLAKGQTESLRATTGLLLKSNMLAVIGGLVVIAVCGDQIVLLMSGGKFAGAGLTLLLLYVNMIATSQRGVQEMVMQITGHTKILWITSIVSPLALLGVWLFADYGLTVAVSIVTAGSLTANWLAASVLRGKIDWFRFDRRGMLAIFLPGLAAAGIGLYLARWTGPLPAAAIALALFGVFLCFGRPFDEREVNVIERVVGQPAARLLRGLTVAPAPDTTMQPKPPDGRVVISLRGHALSEVLLRPGRYSIGRAADNDLQINSRFISRHHAQLVTSERGTLLEDLKSTNGSFVNGERATSRWLVAGDKVRIGTHELVYHRLAGPTLPQPRLVDAERRSKRAAERQGKRAAAAAPRASRRYLGRGR